MSGLNAIKISLKGRGESFSLPFYQIVFFFLFNRFVGGMKKQVTH